MKSSSQPSTAGSLVKTNSFEGKLSIFQKPRVTTALPRLRQENMVYNGVGGTSKVLQSDFKTSEFFSDPVTVIKTDGTKKKKLSPTFIK